MTSSVVAMSPLTWCVIMSMSSVTMRAQTHTHTHTHKKKKTPSIEEYDYLLSERGRFCSIFPCANCGTFMYQTEDTYVFALHMQPWAFPAYVIYRL